VTAGATGGRRTRRLQRSWPVSARATLERPRDDLVLETEVEPGRFAQVAGPFVHYERTVSTVPGATAISEITTYRLRVPWFAWAFAIPVRWALARRGRPPATPDDAPKTPWWSPPDRLEQRPISVLGLLGAASMVAAFINTLFTQTVNFAADDFGVGDTGVGVAGAMVRVGIVLMLPVAVLADRVGRRRVIVAVAFAAPLVSAAGALAPSFPVLVTTQTVGRPLGLALSFLIAVVAAEEMPRSSRAYAVAILTMASGLGAGLAVASLPLADVSEAGWRFVYLVTLVWLIVAIDLFRRLPETRRFERPHVAAPPLDRTRFAVLATISLLSSLFVAPASVFQNGYLEEERGFSAATIAVFTITSATPAALGLLAGGRLADVGGRRRVIAVGLPLTAACLVTSYSMAGPVMWLAVLAAGISGGMAYPAIAVYRTELFPTGGRSRAAGLLTGAGLVGSIAGLVLMGHLLDAGYSHGIVIAGLALGQLGAVAVALWWLPETAHHELEDINPIDALGAERPLD
jgi:MFS family permease